MAKIHIDLLLVLLISLAACTSKNENKINSTLKKEVIQEKAGHIVLLFDKAPVNSRYTWPGGVTSGLYPHFELRYVDDHAIDHYYIPKLAPEKDTLVVYTKRDIVEIQHAYKGLDVLSYLFYNGDSVLFTYDGNKPIARLLNRNAFDWDINYDLRKRELLSGEKFPGLLRIDPRFAFRDPAFADIQGLNERVAVAREAGYQAALSEQSAEISLLDSLQQHQLISANIYQYYREKSFFDLSNELLLFPPANEVPGLDKLHSADELRAALNRPHENYFYYNKMQLRLRMHYFDNKLPFIKTSNAKFKDYRQVYDSIHSSTLFSKSIKDRLLFSAIGLIIEYFSIDDRETYWKKFKKDVPDTVLHHYLIEKYALDQAISNELHLASIDGKKLSFTDLLAEHKGKIVLVDFWASWCAPCIRAFPASKQVQQDYKDKDIVFVYLSTDEDAEKWKQATAKHLPDSKGNYIIENARASRMLEDLNVQSIPRYIIFDREGKLIHKNAPGPGSMELNIFINQHLTKL